MLEKQGTALPLRALVQRQGQLVWDHDMWLGQRMADYVSAHVDELNALRLAVACAQFDVTPSFGAGDLRSHFGLLGRHKPVRRSPVCASAVAAGYLVCGWAR